MTIQFEQARLDSKSEPNSYNKIKTPEERSRRLADARDHEDSWPEWYSLSPQQRWQESMKLWQFYVQVGGTLDPEPDPQSRFDSFMPRGKAPAYGGSSLRVLGCGRV